MTDAEKSMFKGLVGGHYDYCHFTFRNREKKWRCICDIIRGYLDFQKTKNKHNLKYTNDEKGQA